MSVTKRPLVSPGKVTVDPKLDPDRWAQHQQVIGKVGKSTRKPNT